MKQKTNLPMTAKANLQTKISPAEPLRAKKKAAGNPSDFCPAESNTIRAENTMTDTTQDTATLDKIKNIITKIVDKVEHPDQASSLQEAYEFLKTKATALGIDVNAPDDTNTGSTTSNLPQTDVVTDASGNVLNPAPTSAAANEAVAQTDPANDKPAE